jgi:SAM-dependent methyltransferase
MSFADHFSALAASYATFRPRYPDELTALLAELAPARDLAWDAGAGTGQLSTALAERFARVIATEPAAAQLAEASAHAKVEYRCEPAETSTLADASADLSIAAQAAHWFDWPRYVAEVGRVTRRGGLVGIVGYGNAVVRGAAEQPFARYVQLVDAYWPPGRELVVSGYAPLAWPWPAVAAPAIAMSATWTRDQLFGYVATWSSTARYRKAHGDGALEALAAALPDEPAQIAWPLAIKLARR